MDLADIHRRRMLLMLAGVAAAAAIPLPAWAKKSAPTKGKPGGRSKPGPVNAAPGKFFTDGEHALLDDLAELIIPADARSGGARAAKVADYIDKRLAESIDPEARQSWKDDLAWIDELSRQLHGKPFVSLDAEQKQAFLERASANEDDPKKAEEYAFGTIKWEVAVGYYTSKIGLHDEIGYLGNGVLDDFVGADPKPLASPGRASTPPGSSGSRGSGRDPEKRN